MFLVLWVGLELIKFLRGIRKYYIFFGFMLIFFFFYWKVGVEDKGR